MRLLTVGVLIAVGVIFGWRPPVAVIVGWAFWALHTLTRPAEPGRLRTAIEFILFTLIGTVLGAFAFGAVGGIFGCVVGFTGRLAEVPTTGVFRSGDRQERKPWRLPGTSWSGIPPGIPRSEEPVISRGA
jgi:hypothetical protein